MKPFVIEAPDRISRIADNGQQYIIQLEDGLVRVETVGTGMLDDFYPNAVDQIERLYPALVGLHALIRDKLQHEYSFDINLVCSVTVKSSSHAAAMLKLRDHLDCASSNLGAWDHSGEPILAEVSLRGTPHLYESNDPAILDAEKTPAPVMFEPWKDELVALAHASLNMLDSEEDSVQEEHHHLWLALRAMLATVHNDGADREDVLLAHLLLALHKDIADHETDFMTWLLDEVMALPDGEQIKEVAVEYLALVKNIPESQRAYARLCCRYCTPETGYVCEDHRHQPTLPSAA